MFIASAPPPRASGAQGAHDAADGARLEWDPIVHTARVVDSDAGPRMNALISRRHVLAGAIAGALASTLPLASARPETPWRRYGSAIVIDGCGAPGGSRAAEGAPLAAEFIEDVRLSGLTCVNVTVGPVGTRPPDAAFAQAVKDIQYWEAEIDAHPQVFARIRSAADLDAAQASKRTGLSYAFQDGVSFQEDLSRLETLHRLGVRVIQPTYNRRNLLGDGCLEPANAGLSKTGVEAVQRMNALGILVDLSHCGRQTAADAIRVSTHPVAFTHTGCAALSDHPRNRTDAELRAVADKGGVAGIYFMPYLVVGKQPTAEFVIRHLEHAIKVAGEDHVSIGTDGGVSAEVADDAFRKHFAESTQARIAAGIAAPGEVDGAYLFASDLNSPRRLETLATLLAARGHSDARIEKILGANLQRVFASVWTPGEKR
jgi:membrane dipeptidase